MRTFEDIIPPSRRKEMGMPEQPQEEGPRPAARETRGPRRRRSRFPFITLLVVVLIVAGSIGALVYFSGAEIQITPTTASVPASGTYTATQGAGDLPFQVITASKIGMKSVAGSGSKQVDTAASGKLTIYNKRTSAMKLINNTRFASPSGLIFRIHKAVTVPGGSANSPGTLTVTVYADKTGDAYNIGPANFTVPGLAGTSLQGDVYGRSSEAMSGGASGTVPTVDPSLEASTRSDIVSQLSSQLMDSLKSQVPDGYVLLTGAATTTYQPLQSAPSSTSGQVDVKEQGTVSAVVFPNAALAKAVAQNAPGINYNGEPATFSSTNGLTLVPSGGFPDSSSQAFTFSLSGTAPLVYTVNPGRIAAAVAGKSRSEAKVALTNYPEIDKAVLILRPFWRQAFPQDPSSIKVTVESP